MLRFSQRLTLGKSGPWGVFPNVTLSNTARSGHLYVVGKTGKGKSTFLLGSLLQDIAAGRGCGVIDPHSDLVSDLLALLHKRGLLEPLAQNRHLVYVNPSDRRFTVPFNVLAGPGIPFEIAQNVIEAFRRAWSGTLTEAPHFSNVMLHSLLVLQSVHESLTALPHFLVDRVYREQLLGMAQNAELTSYFHHRYDAWGKQQGALMRESTLNKVTALTLNPHLNLMLGQSENALDLRRIMDEGKVLLVDLGQCDEDSRRLLGSFLTTSFEQAARSRSNLRPSERRPFYLYLDEFQTFTANEGSSQTLANILASARKFGLHLTLAHQYLGQLSEQTRAAVWGNVWTKLVFGISEADARELAQLITLGNVDPQLVKHAGPAGGQHPLYAPLAEQWNQWAATLASQPTRQAILRDHRGKLRQVWALRQSIPLTDQSAIDRLLVTAMQPYGHPPQQKDAGAPSKNAIPERRTWPRYDRC